MGFFSDASVPCLVPSFLPQCGRCGLSRKCVSPKMQVAGNGKHSVLVIGEAPGESEDRVGMPFVGEAGKTLRKLLHQAVRVDLDDCWVTNCVLCRPPGNKIEPKYIDACRPSLVQTIEKLKPKVIILCGGSPIKSLLPLEWKRDIGKVGQWVGWTIPSPYFRAWVCPTFHPSYINRMDNDVVLERLTKEHLVRAFDCVRRRLPIETLDDLRSQVDVVLDQHEASLRLQALSHRDGVLAFDYETTGLKPEADGHRIVSASFCLNGQGTFACMITPELHGDLSAVLRSPDLAKVASNLKFEERWTRAKLGHGVVNWFWDTMQTAHLLDNRPGITSLKFQAYVRMGVPDYEGGVVEHLHAQSANGINTIGKIDPKELLVYNGLDSLLEYRLAMLQQADMVDDGSM